MNEPLIIIITILLSAFFSGMEIAYVSANRLSLQMDSKQGTLTSGILNIFSSNPEQYISTMLVGNNISLVLYGLSIARLLEPVIGTYVQADTLVLLIQTLISTIIILFTAEFLPKTLFRINANGVLRNLALPVLIFYILLFPISRLSMYLSNKIINIFVKDKSLLRNDDNFFTRVDLNHYINQVDQVKDFANKEEDETEVKLFKNALDFSNVKVRDCMVPRTEIQAVDESTSIEDIRNLMIKTGHSKILIYRESVDNMIGYVHSSQIFKNPVSIKSVNNPISIVPETMGASTLLSQFTQNRKSIAVVVDEFGGTSGLVTSEDILEEIFGEIEDEHDSDELHIKNIKENEWIISARYEIAFLNEKYNFDLPENDDYDTLAGLIIHYSENIPKTNTLISVGNFEFRILKSTNIRIELVLMKKLNQY